MQAPSELTKLGKYLRERGIAQSWLAEKMEVKPATINRYCWGVIEPSEAKINRIAEILEVPNVKIS